ncbi:MAG: RNA-directed DNA polymerase [Nocardioidaceae bacterium]
MGPSDWHLDPWGWPELDYLVTKEPDLLLQNCMGSGALEYAPIDVPKENWGTRPAVLTRYHRPVEYQALVDRVSLDLIGDLSKFAYGWRLPAKNPKKAIYARNSQQWDSYRGHLSFLANWYSVALRTDLVSFFASLPIDSVRGAIQDCTPKGDIPDRLCSFLAGFDEKPGRSGLPQRLFASAAIANMYLKPVDDVLIRHSDTVKIRIGGTSLDSQSWARWMDDIWLFGKTRPPHGAHRWTLQSVAQDNGMNLNYSKTEVFEGPDLAEAATADRAQCR